MLEGFRTHTGSGLRISLPVAVAGGGGGGGGGNMSFGIGHGERETACSSISFVKGKKIFCASGLKNEVSVTNLTKQG